MTPAKIKEAAAVRRRQNAILNAVEAVGTMSMAEIHAHFEGTKRHISQGTVGYMIRIGLLEAVPTDKRTKNGNVINTYVVGGKGVGLKSKPHPEAFALGEAWGGHPKSSRSTALRVATGWRGNADRDDVRVRSETK